MTSVESLLHHPTVNTYTALKHTTKMKKLVYMMKILMILRISYLFVPMSLWETCVRACINPWDNNTTTRQILRLLREGNSNCKITKLQLPFVRDGACGEWCCYTCQFMAMAPYRLGDRFEHHRPIFKIFLLLKQKKKSFSRRGWPSLAPSSSDSHSGCWAFRCCLVNQRGPKVLNSKLQVCSVGHGSRGLR